jgi:hypothetical protein
MQEFSGGNDVDALANAGLEVTEFFKKKERTYYMGFLNYCVTLGKVTRRYPALASRAKDLVEVAKSQRLR